MIIRCVLPCLLVMVSGCVIPAKTVLDSDTALELPQEITASRALQTRFYENVSESTLDLASAAVLQDLGFSIDKSEPDLGLLVASKRREAVEARQKAGSIALGLLLGVNIPWDETQLIRASVATRPLTPDGGCVLRITMQRTVWNSARQISRQEAINDPELFEIFFSRLSKSLFLEKETL